MTFDALRRGDVGVLSELLERHGHEIQAVAYLILRDRADAEDVLADTLLRALERGSGLRDPDALRAWLLRIATNLALGHRRRRSRVMELPVAFIGDPPPVDADDRMALLSGLERLPPRTRAAIVLHYYADLTVAAVADVLGTSPNTVKTQLREGLVRLREAVGDAQPHIGSAATEVSRG